MPRLAALLLTGLFFSQAAAAQNLTQNPEFNSNTNGWAAPDPIQLSHTNQDGVRSLGAAELTGVEVDFSPTVSMNQCIDFSTIGTAEPFVLTAEVKPVNHSADEVYLELVSADCNVCSARPRRRPPGSPANQGIWTHVQRVVSAFSPRDGESCGLFRVVVLTAGAATPEETETRIDRVFVSRPIFADGFESGSTFRWTTP